MATNIRFSYNFSSGVSWKGSTAGGSLLLVRLVRILLALGLAGVFLYQLSMETVKFKEGMTTTTFTSKKVSVLNYVLILRYYIKS